MTLELFSSFYHVCLGQNNYGQMTATRNNNNYI
jgi:hypothetical protein